ncbi:NAD-dependent epimerase/dehydratase family protein [Micromonosporaceae bacterium DT55]|uniref:NAD-dependent epimerase/dehydratase family protein n=1 Tax=Melissospora conviva TaxID=3388432 RepID=UPI003C25D09E
MTLAGLRVAVTGASGFCGAEVARRAAAAGADVRCLGRRPGPVGRHVHWDAAAGPPDLSGVDAVLHLAAAVGDPVPGHVIERDFTAVNVDGTARLLDALGARPLVWVSSASVYDPRVRAPRLTEEHPIGGQLTAYGRTKAAGEALALRSGAVVLRPRAVYGRGDPHLLPRLLRAVRAGRILLPGPDGELSLTAVENLADACLAALGWRPGAYNITDARPYRRDETIRAAAQAATGRVIRVGHVPVPLAFAAATAVTRLSRLAGAAPGLTRYAVDQVAHPVVLSIERALAAGYRPRRCFADFLTEGGARPA